MFIPVSAVPAAMGAYLILLAFAIRIGRAGVLSTPNERKSATGV
jgi:hypothetical protein